MHKRFVLNIVARILMTVSFLLFLPLFWAMKDDPGRQEVYSFVFTIAFGLFVSFGVQLLFKVQKKDYEVLNAKDGLAIVGLSWLCLSAFGALPLFFSQVVPCYSDAFFEITSGFTTTGATVFSDVEALPRGILFWRSLTHWLGGMGIIVFCLAIMPALGNNAFQIYKAEAPGITVERIDPRIKETAKALWGVYFFLSFGETVLLMAGGMPFFDSLCHTFGTMATGGFSTKNASIGAYSPYIQWVVIVFMFLAGMNFMLHYQLLKGKQRNPFRNEEFRKYFFLVLIFVLLFTATLFFRKASDHPFREGAFQVVSILTTTGYVTADFDLWPNVLRISLIFLMFIGGCGGSTGGGMKVVRFFVTMKAALRSIVQSLFPNAVLPVRFNNIAIPEKLILSIIAYFVIFVSLFALGFVGLMITDSCDVVTALSASIATLGNIGPGLGLVGATKNYAWISVPGKWLLTFLMLAGRLELYAILILFLPSAWKK